MSKNLKMHTQPSLADPVITHQVYMGGYKVCLN